jgi:hypothetical protein
LAVAGDCPTRPAETWQLAARAAKYCPKGTNGHPQFGKGWSVGGDDTAGGVQLAQRLVGGSLDTFYGGQEQGFG